MRKGVGGRFGIDRSTRRRSQDIVRFSMARGTKEDGGVRFERADDSTHRPDSDIPFELVGKVARAGTMTETSDVESCTTSTRHAV